MVCHQWLVSGFEVELQCADGRVASASCLPVGEYLPGLGYHDVERPSPRTWCLVVVVSEAYCCSLTREQGSHLLFLLAFYPTGPFACASNKLHNIRLYT